ncbi:MAG: DNA polymerase Y family protein [Opitutales bacterium]
MFSALHIPCFALQCRLRLTAEGLKPSAILVEDVTQSSLVLEANAAARQKKITPGISSIQALSRDPNTRVFAQCPTSETSTSRALQNLSLGISPITEETRPGLYISDISGIKDLRPKALARHIQKHIKDLGLSAHMVFAPTPDLAEFGAQSSKSNLLIIRDTQAFLDTCPVNTSCQDHDLIAVLNLWGIKTLGAFTRMPIDAVTDRFGQTGRDLWERAMGRKRRLLVVNPETPTFKESLELEYPLYTLEPLLFILRRFITDLCNQLKCAHLLAQAIEIQLKLEDADPWQKAIQLPEPICWQDTLFSVIEKSLENVQIPGAITGLSLKIEPIEPTAQQRQIFETSIKNPWRLADTIDRLAAIVGEENVGTPSFLNTHRPDAIRLKPLEKTLEIWELEEPEPEPYGPPLRRCRPPQVAHVILHTGRPAYLRTTTLKGRIIDARGPFEISGDWWDQQFWKQTEWDVQLENKQIYRISQSSKGWFFEGSYG